MKKTKKELPPPSRAQFRLLFSFVAGLPDRSEKSIGGFIGLHGSYHRTAWSLVGQGRLKHGPLRDKGCPQIVRGDGWKLTALGRKTLKDYMLLNDNVIRKDQL